MKKEPRKLSRTKAKKYIDGFFSGLDFTADEVKKIKRLAMKYNIKLGAFRRLFCRKCLSQLKGKTRITKRNKTIECENCGFLNKHKLA